MTDAEATRLLDDPAWAALTTGNRALAEGGPLALRFPPEVGPFAALADRSEAAFEALAALVPPGGRLALATLDAPHVPACLETPRRAPLLQMILETPVALPDPTPGPLPLGASDLPAMLDLAGRTQPGPFGPRTPELGRYVGLRDGGALAAMAGERMRFDRFVEISAVCVDPAHRGRGHAAQLVAWLAHDLQARGMTPFLHVFADNAPAIALYRRLGFSHRRELQLTVVTRPAPSA